MTRGVLALAALVLLGGCKEEPPPSPAEPAPVATPSPAPSPPPATPAPADDALGARDLVTEEDFEDESAAAINADNLEAQLDALEREIQGE